MLLELIDKGLFVLFFLSCLTVLRHGYFLGQAFLTSTEEEPKKYRVTPIGLVFLGLSIAFILTSIFTGIKL